MNLLSLLESFATAVDEGSLSGAARKRGTSQPAVSKQLQSLEAHIGKDLFYRSTTGIVPTPAGRLTYSHARIMLEQSRRMREELALMDGTLAGQLTVSAPVVIGRDIASRASFKTQAEHPELKIHLGLEDRLVDVVSENIDLALRAGSLGDTEGTAKRIAYGKTILVAASQYLEKMGHPTKPEHLENLSYVEYGQDRADRSLPLVKDGETLQANITVGFTSNHPEVVMSAVQEAVGFTRMPYYLAHEKLEDGALVEVLPDYDSITKSLYAVTPTGGPFTRKQEVFIRNLLAVMEEKQGFTIRKNWL